MLIDGEYMWCVSVPVSGTVTVRSRGMDGTVAVAHSALAPVVTSSVASDFPPVPSASSATRPNDADFQVTMGANGAFPSFTDIRPVTVNLTKATALSSTTLAAPSVANDGLRLTITSQTAAAHVITATTLINDGVSGAPHTTLTFAAFPGASITLQAQNGLWNVISSTAVTVS
jgi:hypothetical protein